MDFKTIARIVVARPAFSHEMSVEMTVETAGKMAGTPTRAMACEIVAAMAPVESDRPAATLHPVDFSTHVLSLASTALIAMGKMPAPDGTPMPIDLETARHLIDVLGMLEQKTHGNLDEAEQKLLGSLTYDLRVAYVDAQKAAAG